MFKIESYITPIILSQVERYVKNIRAEDSQVSLWGGDAVFNNLDLRLEVLEEELHLPFRLVSGHIHELQIHVPWTRLHTEPIVLTINTIECVLKLPGPGDQASEASSSLPSSPDSEKRKISRRAREAEQTAPPGYIQGLINKVISNIQVVCNNVILKYVEDDLVLSINVRTTSLTSCDSKWQPAFTELSLPDLVSRKLLTVSDLTICLDRRNSLGKIEVYQDPLLYRCSLAVRVGWCYQSITSKLPFRTLFNVLADRMDFSMTGLQVPMVARLFKLFLAFYYGEMGSKTAGERRNSKPEEEEKEKKEEDTEEDVGGTLGGLLWDVGSTLGSTLLPIYWEEDDPGQEQASSLPSAQLSSQLGFYVREASITVKLATNVKQKGFYGGGKQCFNPYIVCRLQGVYSEVSTLGSCWSEVQAGVSQMVVSPIVCPGLVDEAVSNYLLAGCESNKYLDNSLFQPDKGDDEQSGIQQLSLSEEKNWDSHVDRVNETSLLEKTPAFAMDYVYNIELPEDLSSEDSSVRDFEQSNLPERAMCRVVVGPTQIHTTQGLIQRVRTMQELLLHYDYVPYTSDREEPGPEGLALPTQEEVDSLENNSPVRVSRLTLLHPSLSFHYNGAILEGGLQCLDLAYQVPMYPLRNVKAGCLMHPPSRTILNNCHSSISVTLSDAWLKLALKKSSLRLFSLDKAVLTHRSLMFKQFWKNQYQKHGDLSLKFDALQITSSLPQLKMLQEMLTNMLRSKLDSSESLLVAECTGKQHLVISCLLTGSSILWTWTRQIDTLTLSMEGASLSLKSPSGRSKPVPIFSGLPSSPSNIAKMTHASHSPGKVLPEKCKTGWLKFTFQWPSGLLSHSVPTLLFVSMGDSHLLVDTKLKELLASHWNLGEEEVPFSNIPSGTSELSSKHSASPGQHAKPGEVTLLQCLSGTLIDVRVGNVSVYLGDRSLSSLSGQSVPEMVSKLGRSKTEFNLLKLSLAEVDIHNANGRVELSQFTTYPVLFPPAVWTAGKENFPWSISLSDFSLGIATTSGEKVNVLAPVTTNCTFGTSSKGEARNLAVCIHADMTPVQFFLDTLTITGITRVTESLLVAILDTLQYHEKSELPENISKTQPNTEQLQFASPPPPAILQRSVGSVSESATPVTSGNYSKQTHDQEIKEQGIFGHTGLWLQWTVPQWRLTLLAGVPGNRVRFRILFEDSSASVDSQLAYTKWKFRIRSVTGDHFQEVPGGDFVAGNFPGKIISCQPDLLKTIYAYSPDSAAVEILSDEDEFSQNLLSKGVFNMTITKAEYQNSTKRSKMSTKEKDFQINFKNQPKRILTEFDVELNPVDFFLETSQLKPVLELLQPIISFNIPSRGGQGGKGTKLLLQFNNNNLPMFYLKSKQLRLFLKVPREQIRKPLGNTPPDALVPDFLLLQMLSATVTSQVENPLSRILVSVPLYHEASHHRLLTVPGSPVEDRQYQTELVGLTLATGHWQDLEDRNRPQAKQLLRTMSENPALEWNTRQVNMDEASEVVMVPLLYNFRVKMMVAPAIVYQKYAGESLTLTDEELVAGISVELNVVADLNICASLQQLLFFQALKDEVINFSDLGSPVVPLKPLSVTDSGVDCSSADPGKTISGFAGLGLEDIPVEVLMTCNSVRLAIHKFEQSTAAVGVEDVRMWRRYHHADRMRERKRTLSIGSDDSENKSREKVNVLEDPIPVTIESSTEVGYEGSEEESCVEAKISSSVRLIPLISLTFTQPHIFLSLSRSQQKADLIIYNFLLACAPEGFHLPAKAGKKIPWQRDFPTTLLETRPGKPDLKSGILPALLTLTANEILSDVLSFTVNIERPVLVSASKEKYKQLQRIVPEFGELRKEKDQSPATDHKKDSGTDQGTGVSLKKVKFNTSQLMFIYDCRDTEKSYSVKTCVGGFSGELNIEPQDTCMRVIGDTRIQRLSVTLLFNDLKHPLLAPFNLDVSLNKVFPSESLISHSFVKANFEPVHLHVGPNHIYIAQLLKENLSEFLLTTEDCVDQEILDEEISPDTSPLTVDTETDTEDTTEKHYQDDLRAGAFQFLEPGPDGSDISPAPASYQVMFSKNSLTWCYPQPRALSRMVIFPLPFIEASEFCMYSDENVKVNCDLLYWSETLQTFQVYQSFQLSENNVVHLDLPMLRDKRACSASTTWQVRLNRLADQAFVTPQALVSVLKVDSFSSPKLLPDSQISIKFSSLIVHFHNHLHFSGQLLKDDLADLALDTAFPPDQIVAKLSLSPLSLGASIWPAEQSSQLVQGTMKSMVGLEYVDYTFLCLHSMMKPTEVDLWVQSYQDQQDLSVNTGEMNLSVGPLLLHTLRQSMQVWSQVLNRLNDGSTMEPAPFIPLCQTLVVNETGQTVRFGQADTDENILLQPKHCSIYAWRSHKASQKLHVSVEGHDWRWSESFSLGEGTHRVIVGKDGDSSITIIVQVEMKSSTLKYVKLCGMLNILNLLREHLELRIIPGSRAETRCLIGSYCRPTSVISNCEGLLVKIRFFGLGTPWSGDIPLEGGIAKRKSFMIKLPLKEKGDSTTVWCSILTEKLGGEVRKLVVFSPMYVIHSLLPGEMQTSVRISEEEYVQSLITVKGFGNMEQLDVVGAPENKFSISFKVSHGLPLSSPPLNVSWGIIDQVRDKSKKVSSIDEIIHNSHKYNLRTTLPTGIMLKIKNMKVCEQPRTDCKVSFTEFHPLTNTLCVRVQPHMLVLNSCLLPVLIKQKGSASWLLEPNSVFHPPPMADNGFFFGLQDDKEDEAWGSMLELSDQEWTYLSIRPTVQGIIYLTGNLIYTVELSHNRKAFLTVLSDVSDGIRTLTIKPSFVMVNQTPHSLEVKGELHHEIIGEIHNQNSGSPTSLSLPSNEVKAMFTWPLLSTGEGSILHSVYLSSGLRAWGHRLLVQMDEDIRCCYTLPAHTVDHLNSPVVVLTHHSEGQVFTVVKEDQRPHLLLHNMLPLAILCRQLGGVWGGFNQVEKEQRLFLTMPWLDKGFPFVEQVKDSKLLQFSLENNAWSSGVDITSTQETFVNIPGHGDIKITVECLQPTTHIFVEPISNLEVAARDIRARFSEAASPESVFTSPDSYGTSPSVEERPDKLTTPLLSPESAPASSSRRHSNASSAFSIISKPSNNKDQFNGPVISLKMKEISLAVTDDLLSYEDFQEILRLTISKAELHCRPKTDFSTVYKTLGGQHSQSMEVLFKARDIQIDNQLFKRGLFHFPVILCRQDVGKDMMKNLSSQDNNVFEATMCLSEADNKYLLREFLFKTKPLSLHLEDTLLYKLQEFAASCSSTVSNSPESQSVASKGDTEDLPAHVIFATESASLMVFLNKFVVDNIDLQISVHASVKVFIGLEDSKINLSKFENKDIWTTWYSLGHRLSRHYLSGALFKAGWVVGSLDMIGSPGAFTRNVSDGVKDFIVFPYEGIWHGPWGFMVGLTQGSSSLVKHVSAGTLTSITNFASSMSRNLDKLSLDSEHQLRNEEVRRMRPQGVGEGLINGLSGVGISVLGAIGGLAHHPIQVMLQDGLSPVRIIGGVGKGMVGVVTKPLGSAAELIAQTGQGLLTGSGWARVRKPKLSTVPGLVLDLASSQIKYQWKMVSSQTVLAVDATLFEDGQYVPVSLVLSKAALHIIGEEEDAPRNVFNVGEVRLVDTSSDPTLLVLEITRQDLQAKYQHVNDRVARFVLDSINYAERGLEADPVTDADAGTEKVLIYLSPQARVGLCTMFSQIKEEYLNIGFPVLF